jgi:hypothetical protein
MNRMSIRFLFSALVFTLAALPSLAPPARPAEAQARLLEQSHAQYFARVLAIWIAPMLAQMTGGRFEHKQASTLPTTPMTDPPGYAPVDDDYSYEIVAVRDFWKYGIGLPV